MSTIIIPTPFRKFTSNKTTITTDKKDTHEALTELTLRHPGIKQYILNPNGTLKSNINLLVDDTDFQSSEKESLPLNENSLLAIVPIIYGG